MKHTERKMQRYRSIEFTHKIIERKSIYREDGTTTIRDEILRYPYRAVESDNQLWNPKDHVSKRYV